jgi:hypothetical protein
MVVPLPDTLLPCFCLICFVHSIIYKICDKAILQVLSSLISYCI